MTVSANVSLFMCFVNITTFALDVKTLLDGCPVWPIVVFCAMYSLILIPMSFHDFVEKSDARTSS